MGRQPQDNSVKIVLPNQAGYERIAMVCSASLARMYGCPAEGTNHFEQALIRKLADDIPIAAL
jgi:hypothetical protein